MAFKCNIVLEILLLLLFSGLYWMQEFVTVTMSVT